MFLYLTCHPKSLLILSEEATNIGGSPGLLSSIRSGIGWPVTLLAPSIISLTL
eukprot:TRINITY_DN14809_c0_g1_i1.p2 TRINITY_DN14809_c0_g1~~TRINITY_DN14809_c0_g1_i1.p2  ORF type:complete len:53 (-),score=0.69 TRINITY_DN14809_c0_g1_i1:175-333(-)